MVVVVVVLLLRRRGSGDDGRDDGGDDDVHIISSPSIPVGKLLRLVYMKSSESL